MKIRLVTVVWGREFVDIFLRIGLRSLLAEGNAPALARAHQVTYTIYTTPWGTREFGVQDLDDHDIAFGQVLNK